MPYASDYKTLHGVNVVKFCCYKNFFPSNLLNVLGVPLEQGCSLCCSSIDLYISQWVFLIYLMFLSSDESWVWCVFSLGCYTSLGGKNPCSPRICTYIGGCCCVLRLFQLVPCFFFLMFLKLLVHSFTNVAAVSLVGGGSLALSRSA